jgi:hypothetical protein
MRLPQWESGWEIWAGWQTGTVPAFLKQCGPSFVQKKSNTFNSVTHMTLKVWFKNPNKALKNNKLTKNTQNAYLRIYSIV